MKKINSAFQRIRFGTSSLGWPTALIRSSLPCRPAYTFSAQHVGTNTAIDSDPDPYFGRSYVTLNGADNLTIDAGMYRQATVSGRAWQDSNHDGIQDSGEAGLAYISVALMDQNTRRSGQQRPTR